MRSIAASLAAAVCVGAGDAPATCLARNARHYVGKRVGSGQPIAFVQAAPIGTIEPGSVIATFDRGHYASKAAGAAIYLDRDSHGIRVLMQTGQGTVQERTLRYLGGKEPGSVLDGDRSSVVE
jgi:hypothetical protein